MSLSLAGFPEKDAPLQPKTRLPLLWGFWGSLLHFLPSFSLTCAQFHHTCKLNTPHASSLSWLVLTVTGVLLPCRGERAGSPARSITGLQCSLQRMRVRSSSPVSLSRSGAVSTRGGRSPSSHSGPLFSLSCRSMDYKQESIRTSSTVYSNTPGYKVETGRLVAI